MDVPLRDLAASLNGVRDIADDMDTQAVAALADASLRARHEVIRSLCVVVVCGYFESFLKDVAKTALQDINQRSIPFQALPAKMIAAHYEMGADVLKTRSRNPRRIAWVNSPVEEVARRLGSTTFSEYELLWEAFADTQANPGPETVKMFLERYGCNDIGGSLQAASGMSYAMMKAALDDLLAKRNECAHTGRVTVIPTPSQIRDHCDTVERYGSAVVHVLRQHLAAPPFGLPLNTATEADLATVPSIGPVRANAIVAYRTANGPFKLVADLQKVPGVGPVAFAELRRRTHV